MRTTTPLEIPSGMTAHEMDVACSTSKFYNSQDYLNFHNPTALIKKV